jgi:hypothetical protein
MEINAKGNEEKEFVIIRHTLLLSTAFMALQCVREYQKRGQSARICIYGSEVGGNEE